MSGHNNVPDAVVVDAAVLVDSMFTHHFHLLAKNLMARKLCSFPLLSKFAKNGPELFLQQFETNFN